MPLARTPPLPDAYVKDPSDALMSAAENHVVFQSAPWRVAAWSQTGAQHALAGQPCEDAVGLMAKPGAALSLAVADGVGGGERGDTASQAVAAHWVDAPAPEQLADALQRAQATLLASEQALEQALAQTGAPGAGRSGSMLVGAWLFASGDVVLGHVGDCRAYRYSGGELRALTRDHTYGNLGLLAPPWRRLDHPARMLGGGMMGPPDVQRLRLQPGDALLLCSDGLHGSLGGAALAQNLRQARGALEDSAQALDASQVLTMCQLLAEQAVAAGGQDDIGLALAWYQGETVAEPVENHHTLTDEIQAEWDFSVWPSDDFLATSSELDDNTIEPAAPKE